MRQICYSLLMVATFFSGCRQSSVQVEKKVKKMPVEIAQVQHVLLSIPILSSGIVSTSEEIKLSFKTGGIVAHTYVEEGMRVKKGQLLARLNTTEIKAQVNQAKSMYEKTLRDFERAESLYKDSVATLEMRQNSETALSVSKSVLDAAVFNLNHSEIRAPEDGIILKEIIHENELVSPGYPVYLLGIKDKDWIIKSGVADRDMVKVHLGDTAHIQIDAWPDEEFIAVIDQIAEVPNPQTGTYELELQLEETEKHLATGFVAKLEIYPARKDSFSLVPVEAMVDMNGKEGYVFVPDEEIRAKKVKVTVETLLDGKAAVSKGLEGFEKVITSGSAYLKNDDLIKINR